MIGSDLGPYRIEAQLGSGAMGRVFSATVVGRAPGLAEGTRVAVKVMRPELFQKPGFFKRFLREGRLGQEVDHPNVVRTLDCDQLLVGTDAHSILVMEYVEGRTLAELLAELRRVPEDLCRHIGREIAKGLGAIHAAGAIHRDLKPANVLITPRHEVKVMDLGIARHVDAVQLTKSDAFVGSYQYAPPESLRPRSVPDPRVDVYSLGVLLYELASGRLPFEARALRPLLRKILHEEPARLRDLADVSAFFDEFVHRLLAKSPAARFASAGDALEALADGEDSAWWTERSAELRASADRAPPRLRVARDTPVVGRDEDLALLSAAFADAAAGDGSALVLEGEAGIGKTRLVDEFVHTQEAAGARFHFLVGTNAPDPSGADPGAFTSAFRRQIGAHGAAAAYLSEAPQLQPAFDALLGSNTPPPGELRLTPDAIATCFVHAARALGTERTTVIVIEDLHDAPADTLSVFTAIAAAAAGHRILLVGTLRPEMADARVGKSWLDELERIDGFRRHRLDRLPREHVRPLLRALDDRRHYSDSLVERIAQLSEGNPFFVLEIVRGMQLATLKPDEAATRVAGSEAVDGIPSSVMELVEQRVAKLAAEERRLVHVAACCGFRFDPDLLADVIGLERIPLAMLLRRIEMNERLVRPFGEGYAFEHHRIREAVYARIPPAERATIHSLIASTLVRRGETDGDAGIVLCDHLLRSSEPLRAREFVEAAIERLETGYRLDDAARLARRSLEPAALLEGAQRARVALRWSRNLGLLGRREEQIAAAREALEVAERAGDVPLTVEAGVFLGTGLRDVSENASAEEVLRLAVERASTLGDPALAARAYDGLGGFLFRIDRLEDAATHLRRMLELAREAGDRPCEADAMGRLGLVIAKQGRTAEALQYLEFQLEILREVGNRHGEAVVIGNVGTVAWSGGRYDEALRLFEQQFALAREVGHRACESDAVGNLGAVHLRRGDFDEAQRYFERHLDLCREIRDRRGEARTTGSMGGLHVLHGRLREARALTARHLSLARSIGNRQGESHAAGNLASICCMLGQLDQALALMQAAHDQAAEIGDRYSQAYFLFGLARVAVARADPAEAERLLRAALFVRRDIGHLDGVADALAELGAVLVAAGRGDEARPLLEEALEVVAETGSPGPDVRARCALAALPGGDPDAAARAYDAVATKLPWDTRVETLFRLWQVTADPARLTAAKDLLDTGIASAPPELRASMTTAVPLHRDLLAAWNEHATKE